MASEFDWYDQAIAGDPPPLINGQVESGWWRLIKPDRSMVPVATWTDPGSGEKFVRVGVNPPVSIEEREDVFFGEVFTRCSQCPIEEETYFSVLDGAPWPDVPEEVIARFSNLPPGDWTAFEAQLALEENLAAGWLKRVGGQASTEEEVTRVGLWTKRLSSIRKMGEAAYGERRKPIEAALKACREEHTPALDRARALSDRLKDSTRAWLEQDRVRKEAERMKALHEGRKPPPKRAAGTGVTGSKVTLRADLKAEVLDHAAALAFFADREEVRELVQRLANGLARSGATEIPGCRIVEVRSVA